MDGNLKMKLYENDTYYVVNHETNTIYNDVVHFHQYKLNEALKSYNSFPQQDATILVRGLDGLIIKKKGDDQYISQNLAYLYNDFESQGQEQKLPYKTVFDLSQDLQYTNQTKTEEPKILTEFYSTTS